MLAHKKIVKVILVSLALLSLFVGVVSAESDSLAHFQLHNKIVPLPEDGIHDPENDSIDILQPPYKALADFPRDSGGLIDWIGAIDNGLINPRADIAGELKMHAVDLDLVLKNTSSMPYVRFPHQPHTKWLTCENCHPSIFLPQNGGNFITMADIMQGRFCGVCHGKVAFPPLECARCHSLPKDTGGLR